VSLPTAGVREMNSGLEKQVSGRRHLLENIFFLYLLQGVNYLIPMAVLPYLIRVLGVEVYGLVAFSQAFAAYFILFTDYGFNLSATRYIAKHKDSPQDVQAMFWQVYILKISLTIVGFIILLALTFVVSRIRHDSTYFLWAYLSVLGNVLLPQWYFQGVEKMKYISLCTGTAKLLSAVFLFVWVHHPQDGLLVIIIQSGGMLIAGVIGFVVAFREIDDKRFVMPSKLSLLDTLSDGWHLFISMASVSLYTNTNLVLVGLLAGNIQAGYFSAAEKLVKAMSGLISPAMQAFFPHVNSLMSRSRERALRAIASVLRWTAGCTFLASAFLMLFAGPIAALALGPDAVVGSLGVIRWIAFLPFLIGLSNVLGLQTMLPLGFDRQFSRILLASGLINIALGVPLIHFVGAAGAGISVLTTEACVTIAMVVFLQRNNIRVFSLELS